ncbi:HAD-like protein [Flagelloscypha sp. PMI_526]|nr:HAD-like protein [Flagelloscypha sp. PMI_526]
MASNVPVEYVLFDLDGLMINTEEVYTDVTNEILAPFGVSMTWETKAGCMGKPELEAASYLLSHFPDIDLSVETYLTERNRLQDLKWPHTKLLPGVEKLVTHLARCHVPICVATGSKRRNFELKTGHLSQIFDLFEGNVVCADDAKYVAMGMRGKPDPDVFLVAAREVLGRDIGAIGVDANPTAKQLLERQKGLVFEDSLPGLQAGKNAGMNVVWVPDPNLIDLKQDTPSPTNFADSTLQTLEDFKPQDWGLPPYD